MSGNACSQSLSVTPKRAAAPRTSRSTPLIVRFPKEVLVGLWAGQSEGAKFWLQVLTQLKNRVVATSMG